MSAWVYNWLNVLRASLWLIPSCMAILAVMLSLAVPYLDTFFSPQAIDSLRWLRNMGPEGAMTLLSTIAGSMITIAGVVFSITIVALTLASAQFGPRLLGNFLRDRGNQIVLGTFVATFLYCLLVLRTIHMDPNGHTPYWGTLVGLLLAVCSLGVLIFFMHHIAVSIQAPHLIAVVYGELEENMTRLFPERLGQEQEPEEDKEYIGEVMERIDREGVEIPAETSGYLQAVESDTLMEIAQEENLVVLLHYRPGQFVIKETAIGKILPQGAFKACITKNITEQFICGAQRTQEQDLEFTVHQLVEVAVRALSPGVNDPFTCIQCIDHLSAMLCQLVGRQFPSPYRYDHTHALRIIVPPVTFHIIVNAAFDQIRQHGKGNLAVTLRLLEGLGRIAECAGEEQRRKVIARHVELIQRGSRASFPDFNDREEAENGCRQVLALLSAREKRSVLLKKKLLQQVF